MKRKPPDRKWARDRPRDEPQGRRSPEVERLERDSFILLQHAYTLTGADSSAPVSPARLGCELAFPETETSRLIRYLSWIGYLKESAADPHLCVADEGIEYLERGAGRRHTVRVSDSDVPLPLLLGR